jgi:hypothetical protein
MYKKKNNQNSLKIGINFNSPFARIDTITAVNNESNANVQFSFAIFTPVPASESPINIITGPITTGGNRRSINLIPCHLTKALITK